NSTADSLVPAAFLTHLISAGVLKSTAARSMSAALTVTADGIGTSKLSRIIPTDRVMVPPRRFVGWLRDFLLLRVFPRKLRRKTIPSLFLALQARFARPGAFEVVANFYAQAAERLGFGLDQDRAARPPAHKNSRRPQTHLGARNALAAPGKGMGWFYAAAYGEIREAIRSLAASQRISGEAP